MARVISSKEHFKMAIFVFLSLPFKKVLDWLTNLLKRLSVQIPLVFQKILNVWDGFFKKTLRWNMEMLKYFQNYSKLSRYSLPNILSCGRCAAPYVTLLETCFLNSERHRFFRSATISICWVTEKLVDM